MASVALQDVTETLTFRGYNIVSQCGKGFGLSVTIKPDSPDYKPGPGFITEKVIGFISENQRDEYLRSSDSVEDCANRIEAHIVKGKRSDLSLATLTMLEEVKSEMREQAERDKQNLVSLLSAEIAELKAAVRGEPKPTVEAKAPEPVAVVEPEAVVESEPVPRPVTAKPRGKPRKFTDDDIVRMAKECNAVRSPNMKESLWYQSVVRLHKRHMERMARVADVSVT